MRLRMSGEFAKNRQPFGNMASLDEQSPATRQRLLVRRSLQNRKRSIAIVLCSRNQRLEPNRGCWIKRNCLIGQRLRSCQVVLFECQLTLETENRRPQSWRERLPAP